MTYSLNIAGCQALDVAGTTYVLTTSVFASDIASDTCFTIGANNIILDGAGYNITYADNAGTGYGIDNNINGYDNLTIKNAKFIDGKSGINSYAIYGSGMSNSTIINNTITTSTDGSDGIELDESSDSNNITGNTIKLTTIDSTYSTAIVIGASNYNRIYNNTLNDSGDEGNGGVWLYGTSNYTWIYNNTIITNSLNSTGVGLENYSYRNNISNNNITTSNTNGYGVYLDTSSTSNTIENNNITTAGNDGDGVHLNTSSNSNNISRNTISTSLGTGISIFSSSNNIINNTIIRTSSSIEDGISIDGGGESNFVSGNNITLTSGVSSGGYGVGVYASSGNNSIVDNTVSTANTNGHGVYIGTSSNSNNITNNTISTATGNGISLFSTNSNNIINNTVIRTSNSNDDGIDIDTDSNSNTVSGNNITLTSDVGDSGYGIGIYASSDNNNISDNNITTANTNGHGVHIGSSLNNSVTRGSIISQKGAAYSLNDASNTNNFTNTNFTALRTINFSDSTSWFNYRNDSSNNIWLKTNVSAAGSINRTLITWSNSTMKWNDTNVTATLMARYNLTGLLATTIYNISNTSNGIRTNPYTIQTDSNGALSFNISINENTEILVTSTASDSTPPFIDFVYPTPGDGSSTANNWTYVNVTVSDSESPDNLTAFINWNNSLVGWWRFNNETSENNTLFRDWSGNGNNGTCLGTKCPVYNASGRFGSALTFDNSNDVVNVSTSDLLLNPNQPATIMAWVYLKPSTTSNALRIINRRSVSSDDWGISLAREDGDVVRFRVDGATTMDRITSTKLLNNTWTFIAVTWDGSVTASNVHIFINGSEGAYGTSIDGATPDSTSGQMTMIGNSPIGTRTWNGNIDEILIFNRILSPEEINASYNAGTYRLYHNFTNLTEGTYTYIAYAQDMAGNVNQTEMRTLTVGTPPFIGFIDPTPGDGSSTANNWTYINVSVANGSSPGNLTAFINWNNSLIGWWRFNHEAGENDTRVIDYSGYGNNGTMTNMNPGIDNCTGNCSGWTTSGKFGYGMNFDGKDDYVDAGNAGIFNITTQFTIEAWIYENDHNVWHTIVSKGESFLDRDNNYYLEINRSGNIYFIIGNGTNYRDYVATNSLSTKKWYYVAAVFYSTTDMRIYVDGINQSGIYVGDETISLTPNSKKLYIGTDTGSNDTMNGTLDEVKIWNRALSPEEINASYNAGTYRLYHNFTNLTDGAYSYTAYAQDLAGNVNQTGTRTITYSNDIILPTISIISPLNQSYNTTTIWFNITLNEPASWAAYSLNGAPNQTLENSSGNWNKENTESLYEGSNTIIFYANDSAGNMNVSEILYFTVDIFEPNVTLISPELNYNTSTAPINFSFNVTDNLNTSMVCSLYINGTLIATNTTTLNATTTTFADVPVSIGTGQNWTVSCSDGTNSNTPANRTFNVDNVIPSSNAPVDASYSQGASATIEWILYDNYAGEYYAVYRNGTMQNQSAWQNDTNLNVWVNTSTFGTWNYTIEYNDSLGNIGIPDTVIIDITGDLTAPKYSLNSTNSTDAGKSVKHTLYWTDDIQLSGYIFSFDNGTGAFSNDSWIALNGTGNWSNVTKTVNSTIGTTINWKVYANDTSNNWNASSIYAYNTTSCTESWSYSAWSACSAGTQARTASDANSCGTTANQSALTQSCSSGSSGSGGGYSDTSTKLLIVTPQEPLIKVYIMFKTAISSPSLTITEVSSVPAAFPTDVQYSKYLNFTKNRFSNTDIENTTIDFRVSKSWINSNRIGEVYLAQYDNGWTKLRTELTNETDTYKRYRAYLEGVSYFVIVGVPIAENPAQVPDNATPSEPANIADTQNPNLQKDQVSEPVSLKNTFNYAYLFYIALLIVFCVVVYAILKNKRAKRSPDEIMPYKIPKPPAPFLNINNTYKTPLNPLETAQSKQNLQATIQATQKPALSEFDAAIEAILKRIEEIKKRIAVGASTTVMSWKLFKETQSKRHNATVGSNTPEGAYTENKNIDSILKHVENVKNRIVPNARNPSKAIQNKTQKPVSSTDSNLQENQSKDESFEDIVKHLETVKKKIDA